MYAYIPCNRGYMVYIQARSLGWGPKGPPSKGTVLYVYIPYNRGYMVYIQARPLERGPLRAPIQGDGLVCLVFNEYLSVQEISSLEL